MTAIRMMQRKLHLFILKAQVMQFKSYKMGIKRHSESNIFCQLKKSVDNPLPIIIPA